MRIGEQCNPVFREEGYQYAYVVSRASGSAPCQSCADRQTSCDDECSREVGEGSSDVLITFMRGARPISGASEVVAADERTRGSLLMVWSRLGSELQYAPHDAFLFGRPPTLYKLDA